jgi:hypothetical protein
MTASISRICLSSPMLMNPEIPNNISQIASTTVPILDKFMDELLKIKEVGGYKNMSKRITDKRFLCK